MCEFFIVYWSLHGHIFHFFYLTTEKKAIVHRVMWQKVSPHIFACEYVGQTFFFSWPELAFFFILSFQCKDGERCKYGQVGRLHRSKS